MFNTAITTTGVYNFAPASGEFVLTAFGRIGVRPSALTQSHMFQARMALNLIMSEWANQQPSLWVVGLQSFPLTQAVATYAVPSATVMILDLYLSCGGTDKYLWPVSRTDYASYAVKTTQGPPNVFWYDRLISQTVTFYPVPDGSGPYVAKFYSVRQTQDSDVINGTVPEIPFRFYEAYVSGLAWKLAEIYAPQLEDKLFARYQRAWTIAATNDVENVNLYITPAIGGYFS
jgi:hypothetical protein